jgi:hypothetical protein
MKRTLASAALAALVATAASAQPPVPAANNNLCTIQTAPSPTLLLPYFEVNIDDPSGVDTFFSINNALPYGVLGHVVVWTDMSVEALDFNVYLTGYDVQTIGMGLIIRDGILPVTSYFDSPVGSYSWDQPIAIYQQCLSILPYNEPALDADFLTHLQSILTGGPSAIYGGRCGGFPYGDSIARGYVTVDNVLDCTVLTPCDNGYFTVDVNSPPDGLLGYYLPAFWGDWYMIDYANNFAQGDTLVHVESFQSYLDFVSGGSIEEMPTPAENLQRALAAHQPQGGLGGDVGFGLFGATFWGRCATVFDPDHIVLDYREPLGTTYAARFYQNAAFTGGTDFLVWRDSNFNVLFGEEDGFSCAAGPSWFPLNERQVVFFDEQENPETACTISPCPESDILFPLEAQRVSIADVDVTPDSGWSYMNLNQLWFVNEEPTVVASQAWVTAVHSAEGRFSAGLPAVQLDSMCDFTSILLGPTGPDFPAQEETYSPFYLGFYTGGALPLRAPQGTVKNPLKP